MTDEWLDTKLLEFQRWNLTSGAAKQPRPTYCCKETAPPHYSVNTCISCWYMVYARPHNQAKKARFYTAAKQLMPPAKRATSSATVKQNWHASRCRGLGRSRNTESSTKWILDNFKTCMVARRNFSSAEQSFLHGWTYFDTCYFSCVLI